MNRYHLFVSRAVAGLLIGLQVSCGGSGGSGGPVSLAMSVDPTTITLSQSATITWEWQTPDGGSCHASGAWRGDRRSRGSEVVTPTETGALTYTLDCIEDILLGPRFRTASVTLTVNAAAASAGAAAKTTNRTLVSPRFAYVTNAFAQSVSVIDTTTNQIAATIAFPAGSVPFAAAITPDLRKVYVSSMDALSTCGNTAVFMIDTASNTLGASPAAVGCGPTGIAITPDGKFAYVASQQGDTVSVIDTAMDAVSTTIPLSGGGGLANIAISPDGQRAYATVLAGSSVLTIDTSSNTVLGTPIDVGGFNPTGIAISPDGTRIYVTNNNAAGSVTVIDTATNTAVATIAVGEYPSAVAFTPDGTRVYVAGGIYVSVIDTASYAVVGDPIAVGRGPNSIAITADGTQAYVGNEGSNTLSVIDTASNTVTATLSGMNSPRGVAVRPIPPGILVPNVVGATQAAATTAIADAGLTVGTVTQQASLTIVPGNVISQSPAAAAFVGSGAAVDLVISSGVAVPSVTGLSQAAATSAITAAGLMVGTITRQSSSKVASGSVISQNPAAGTQLAGGSAVSLVVSSGGGGGGAFDWLTVLFLACLVFRSEICSVTRATSR